MIFPTFVEVLSEKEIFVKYNDGLEGEINLIF